MNTVTITVAFASVGLFYLIYHRYFVFKPILSKHLQALLSGIAFALLLVLSAPLLNRMLPYNNLYFTAFIKAAFLEKVGAFVILLLIYRHFRNFSLLEAVLTAMMFGLGFAAVENIFYAFRFGSNLAVIRLLFSSPLHLTTCAMMGYFLGRYVFASTGLYKFQTIVYAAFVPFVLHGCFDLLLLHGGYTSYLIAPLLIGTVFVLEYMMARSQTVMPIDILEAMKLRFEDYTVINKQKKYERWIKQSMGLPDAEDVALFLGKPSTLRMTGFFMLIFIALVGLSLRYEIFSLLEVSIRREEEVILLGIFPSFIGLTVLLVGSINPDFFKMSELKIPVITDVEVLMGDTVDETMVTYDITGANCFLRTSEPLGLKKKVDVRFSFQEHYSEHIEAEVLWENHSNKREAMGTVVAINKKSPEFLLFLMQYNWFRFFKGIVFTFKLPGFESTRKLFMRPISAVEEDAVYPAGTVLFREGEIGERFFLIKKGSVILYKKKDGDEIITVDTIDHGQILGEMSLSQDSRHTVSAICADNCIIASAAKQNLNALLVHNIEFSRSFIDTLVERISMSERILVEYIKEVEKSKKENERFFHASLMMILLELGYSPEGFSTGIDLKSLSAAVKNMSSEDMGEMIDLITYKLTRTNDEKEQANKIISRKLKDIYSKFEIDV